jgi:hypothetical protein
MAHNFMVLFAVSANAEQTMVAHAQMGINLIAEACRLCPT